MKENVSMKDIARICNVAVSTVSKAMNELLKQSFARVILSNKKDKSYAYNKAVIVPMKLKEKSAWQMTKYTDKQAFQENLMTLADLTNCVKDLFENKYKQLNLVELIYILLRLQFQLKYCLLLP